MTNQTNKTTPYTEPYTETQAINLTIQYGFDGSEFNDKTFQQRGCLRKDNTYKKLLRKLESIADVEVTGRGKKRIYYLSNFRKEEEIEERYSQSDKRGGREPTLMHRLLFYQIFLVLKDYEGEELTKTKIHSIISPYNAPKIFNENNFEFQNAVCYISGISNHHEEYLPKLSYFKRQFNSSLTTIIKTALKQLERRGHISKTTSTYARVQANDELVYQVISREYYDKLSESFDIAIKQTLGTNKNKLDYLNLFFKDKPTDDEIGKVKEIKDMSNNDNIEYVFKKYTYRFHSTAEQVLNEILSITKHKDQRIHSEQEIKDIIQQEYDMSFDFITSHSPIPRFRLFNRKMAEYSKSDKRSETYLRKKELTAFNYYYIKSNYIYNFDVLRASDIGHDVVNNQIHDELIDKSQKLMNHDISFGSNIYNDDYIHPSRDLLKVIHLILKDEYHLQEANDMFYGYFREMIDFHDMEI